VRLFFTHSKGNFKIEVSSEDNGNMTIYVFNSFGQIVQSVKNIKNKIYQKEFNLVNLVPGTYYINVKINGFVKTKAIIVY
jgi:glycopeptide antibiotics resistance protein